MTQSIDPQQSSLEDILEILQSEVQSLPPSPTSTRYLRALLSLKSSVMVGTHGLCVRVPSIERAAGLSQGENPAEPILRSRYCEADTPNDNLSLIINNLSLAITDWLINQWLLQTPFTTASLYLDIISALYGSAVKAGRLPKTDLFSKLKAQLKQLGSDGWKSGIDDEIFARALRLTKNAANLISDDAIAADLLLLSLTQSGPDSILRSAPILNNALRADTQYSLLPLQQLALLTKDDCVAMDRRASGRRVPSMERAVVNGKEASRLLVPSREPSHDCAAGLSPVHGACSPSEDLRLKTEDSADTAKPILREAPILQTILLRHGGSARRKFIFPLRQSGRTDAQLKKHVFKIVNDLFRRARLPQATDPNQTVEALWAYAALRAGIPGSAVVAFLGHAPLGLPVLKLSVGSYKLSESGQAANDDLVGIYGSCVRVPSDSVTEGGLRPSPRDASNYGQSDESAASYNLQLTTHNSNNCAAGLSQGETNSTPLNSSPLTLNSFQKNFSQIGKVFLDNPPRWYALSLRPGVRFTQLSRRIETLQAPRPPKGGATVSSETPPLGGWGASLSLFYPCEEIARAIGKKIVIKQRPFIHSVVFFKARLTDIGRLFAKIGDLAWCYRQSAAPGAPYAAISQKEFERFQQTIATFTPDYEVAASGELELKKNDRVEILGGLFAGHTATFEGYGRTASQPSRQPSEHVDSALRAREPSSAFSASHAPLRFNTASADTPYCEADTPTTVYRLNIIGDNGIEWRITVDPRLAASKN